MNKAELKRRLSLFRVLLHYGHRAHSDDCKIACPLPHHYDTEPSFHYNGSIERFFCFGCGAKGDVFNFIMEMEGVNFVHAIKIAEDIYLGKNADSFNEEVVAKPNRKSCQKKATSSRKSSGVCSKGTPVGMDLNRWSEMLEAIHKLFPLPADIRVSHLRGIACIDITGSVPQIGKDRKYWTKAISEQFVPPNFDDRTIVNNRIGYIGRIHKGLVNKLRKLGFSDIELMQTGIFGKDKNNRLYLARRWYGRILYPFIQDGRIVSFIGRKAEGFFTEAKYIYSSRHPMVPHVYNIDVIKEAGCVVISEGVTDCLKLQQIGVATISPVTTYFNENTLRRLPDLLKGKRVIICFDTDKNGSGQRGARKLLRRLQEFAIDARVVELSLPEGSEKIDVCEHINTCGSVEIKHLLSMAGYSFPFFGAE